MGETCATCRFSKHFMFNHALSCVRFPPPQAGLGNRFPSVNSDDWCGEYRPKEIGSLSKEDAEIIQHEVDQLPPVKPSKVYALAFSEWFNRESGRVPGDVKLCGVYASREVMEKAKAKFIEDDACRAKIDGRPRQTFTWYAWEGQPMGGEEPANG